MRKEQFGIGTFAHVMNRGAHKVDIVHTDDDCWRFLKLIRYLNDANVPRNWERDISPEHIRNNFARPEHWGVVQPYVSILAHCLQDNHFHLFLLEQMECGISKFMQRVSRSMAAYHNARCGGSGALFQGPYRARVVGDDRHFQHLAVYINIKNVLEMYPGGLEAASKNFDDAYSWAVAYPFSSTADFAGERKSSIIDHALLQSLFASPADFRLAAEEFLESQPDDLQEAHDFLFNE